MKQIEDGNETHTLTIEFKDENNDYVVPASVSYKVYCVTTDTLLVDTTALTPASTITLNLTGDMVTLQEATNVKEVKRICVTSIDSEDRTLNKCFEYEVIDAGDCSCG